MNLLIISTKNCKHHRSLLEKQLQSKGIPYTVKFVEDNPELIEKYNIHNALIIVVKDKVVFRHTGEKPILSADELQKFIEN
ncbi:MAG: thioredoxin family protein [Ignavibacteriae bacterium]|jgi:succinylarginine dihydrolase|nr:thioredoxin family protein [Ignavibacteriota bacterium]